MTDDDAHIRDAYAREDRESPSYPTPEWIRAHEVKLEERCPLCGTVHSVGTECAISFDGKEGKFISDIPSHSPDMRDQKTEADELFEQMSELCEGKDGRVVFEALSTMIVFWLTVYAPQDTAGMLKAFMAETEKLLEFSQRGHLPNK